MPSRKGCRDYDDVRCKLLYCDWWWLLMNKAVLGALSVLLAGCTTYAAPNFINGQYYMAGDSNCKSYRVISDSKIVCFDSNNNMYEYRSAMTSQQLQMYQYQQYNQQMQMQQLNQQIQQTGQSFQQSAQQSYQQTQQYVAPQVMPIDSPGSNQIRCINAGIYTNCRY